MRSRRRSRPSWSAACTFDSGVSATRPRSCSYRSQPAGGRRGSSRRRTPRTDRSGTSCADRVTPPPYRRFVGYRGKVREREEGRVDSARRGRRSPRRGSTRVSKSSVSLWVRDVPFTPSKRRWGPQHRPNPADTRKQAEIADCGTPSGSLDFGVLSEQALLAARDRASCRRRVEARW